MNSENDLLLPFRLIPPVKDYIWGGTRLRDEFNKNSSLERLAESWELSCHNDGRSIIADGEYEGITLNEYLEKNPGAAGKNCGRFEYFPVLIKLIDAKNDLSVQVHPDDEYAMAAEGEYGKTEMWYIIDCEPGAELIYGFREKITREQFRAAIENNTLLDYVNKVPVKPGDVFFIPSGTLHAIGKGILIAEIQQNSNTTYRVYDYGRLGADGRPRELHIEKAIDVTKLEKPENKPLYAPAGSGDSMQNIGFCDYFTVNKYDSTDSFGLVPEDTFIHLLVINGSGKLISPDHENFELPLEKGTSVFIPADTGRYVIKGKISVITTAVPVSDTQAEK